MDELRAVRVVKVINDGRRKDIYAERDWVGRKGSEN
jgi:hypothetical protein